MFKCECCGCCCRNLDKNKIYSALDRGDGVCIYLRENLCSIYENRPLLCRVDESYDLLFSGLITREEYYFKNKQICKVLKKSEE